MTDAMTTEADHETTAAEMPGGPPPPAPRSIVPRDSIAGRALVAVIAIMTFLAALTLGAVVLIRATATEWQSEVSREVTIQLRPVPGRDIETDMKAAAAIAEKQPGQTLQQLMSSDLDGFKQRFPNMNVTEAKDLPAGDSQLAKVRFFYGVNQGSYELVAYVDEPQVVALLVLSSRSKQALGEALPAFREVLKSYVYMDMTTGASVGLTAK